LILPTTPSLGRFAFDRGDDVAATHAALVGGRAFVDAGDGDVAVDRPDQDADAVVASLLAFAALRKALRIHEARMRIERLQQADDRAVDQAIRLHLAEIVVFHRVQRCGEDLVLIGDRILRSQRGASEEGSREPACHHGDDGDRQGAMSTH
jgi:hypothetical protein